MSSEKSLAVMVERRDNIREWLVEQGDVADLEQRHLDSGSSEQTYWHHGYQAALDDMLKLLSQ
jgi:hypothetical protein